ncbi:MAG: hypothetical protein HGA45_39995 [Chloroflexales bacterium]|nr:hypothetical protein [Chloroflexales bacterium]
MVIAQRRIFLFAVLALLLSACANSAPVPTPTAVSTAPASSPEAGAPTAAPSPAGAFGLTPATIADDEGGPVIIEGAMSYTNEQVAQVYTLPTPLLFTSACR